jgi:hypothetical protein
MSTQEYFREYYLKNKEKLKQKSKENYHKNKTPLKNHLRYLKRRKESIESSKRWRENNKELKSKTDKEYRITHKEKLKEYFNQYRKKNKEKINLYLRNKRKTDVNFRIKHNLRKRLGEVLKGNSKSKHTLKLLGCEYNDFIKYIESQFITGMSWHNYGYRGWHIDHKIPCDNFDLSKPEEQEKCFHYTNLQPMWGIENIRKGNRFPKS